jgi:hypothetical protein
MEQTVCKEEILPVSDITPVKMQDKIEKAASEIGNVILGQVPRSSRRKPHS